METLCRRPKARFLSPAIALVVCIGLMLGLCSAALATQPLPPEKIRQLKAEGKYKRWLEAVENLGNHRVAPLLVEKFKRKLERLRRKSLQSQGLASYAPLDAPAAGGPQPGRHRLLQSRGHPKTFTILIRLADFPPSRGSTEIDEMLYGGSSDSLASYYDHSSYGYLNLHFGTTFDWVTLNKQQGQIFRTSVAREGVIKAVLNTLDSNGHDFSQYDNDGDGYIDYFIVIWTGVEDVRGTDGAIPFWWPYHTLWLDEAYTIHGKKLSRYTWMPEPAADEGARVAIHETGHAFGLPDLYDYKEDVGPKGGVGSFDMMDSNHGDHNCFSKWLLDWIEEPIVVSDGMMAVTLENAATYADCVLLWPGIVRDDMFSEFFLVENRQSVHNDTSVTWFAPDGLAIWHVDATVSDDQQSFKYDNSFTDHKMIRIMEADGQEDIEKDLGQGAGDIICTGTCSNKPTVECLDEDRCKAIDNEDLYNGFKSFGPSTVPSSAPYDGSPACARVWDIVDLSEVPGAPITARFSAECVCSEPSQAVLSTPADRAIDVSRTPNLAWSFEASSVSYQVKVCTDLACEDVVRSKTVSTNSWALSPALEEGSRYWWQVRANNSCGPGWWSGSWKFTTLCSAPASTAPQLVSPPDGAWGQGPNPMLEWQSVAGASAYEIEVCNDSQCDGVHSAGTTSGTSWRPEAGLQAGPTVYWWRVRADNSCKWSATRMFSSELPTPVLVSPDDGTTNVSLTPTLTWMETAGADSFVVTVSPCSPDDFGCREPAVCSLSVDTTPVTLSGESCPLTQGSWYNWNVVALNSSGLSSQLSATWFFQTCIDPAVPINLSPGQDTSEVPIDLTLDWEEIPNTRQYDVEVCLDSACNDVVRSKAISYPASNPSSQWHVMPFLDEGGQYWWRVRATNPCGTGAWTEPVHFTTTDCQIVPAPGLKNPADGATGVALTPTMSWGLVNFADRYDIYVCSDADCATVIGSGHVYPTPVPANLTYHWTVSTALNGDTPYWWTVGAYRYNACKEHSWSSIRSFETCETPDAPLLVDPGTSRSSGETYELSWSTVSGATSYTVEESTDALFAGAVVTNVTGVSTAFSHILAACESATYYYRVRANNDCGGGVWATTVEMVVAGPQGGASCETGVLGVCAAGIQQCQGGALVCVATTSPSAEICDGLDNDCDGTADEGDLSPAAPAPITPSNRASGASTTPLLEWRSVFDASSYEVWLCSDIGCKSAVATADHLTGTQWTVPVALSKGTEYWWQVRAHNACGAGTWSDTWSFETLVDKGRYGEAESPISYHGTWHDTACPSCDGGAYKYSNETGAYVEFSFHGSGIEWVSVQGPTCGMAAVYIDGIYEGSVDLFHKKEKSRQVVFKRQKISSGTGVHTIRIVVLGTSDKKSSNFDIPLDAFELIP